MKVDVLTVESAKFKKYRFWSDWVDVCLFDYAGNGYLLQMSVNRFNGKKFNHIALKGIGIAHPCCGSVGSLTQMRT